MISWDYYGLETARISFKNLSQIENLGVLNHFNQEVLTKGDSKFKERTVLAPGREQTKS